MAIGSILLGLALLILLGLYLSRPLLKAPTQSNKHFDKRHELEQEKDAYLSEIRALDFDYDTGKIPSEVYDQQRAQLVTEAAVILKQLDDIPAADGDVNSQIEAAVAARRHQHTVSGNGQTGFCAQCGQPHDIGDKFCSSCGQPLNITAPIT